jgi:flavodoxin
MKTVIVYESQFGNTRHIAEVIGRQLETRGPVRLMSIGENHDVDLEAIDLLVVGGPTQAHTTTQAMRQFLAQLKAPAKAKLAAAFDTRINIPKLLSGSAAKPIAKMLKAAGFEIAVEGESFLVIGGKENALVPGELEHARLWAARLIAAAAPREAVTA